MSDIPQITRTQYGEWRHHPVTQTVFRFLEAYRDQLRAEHVKRWEQGELDEQLEMRALGVVLFTESFLELSYDAILAAYGDNEELPSTEFMGR